MASFMSLPNEIRLMIYRHLLCSPDDRVRLWYQMSDSTLQIFSSSHTYMQVKPKRFAFHTAILCSSRQIYTEAVVVLYAENVFDLALGTSLAYRNLVNFPKKRLNLIRYVEIDVGEAKTRSTAQKFLSGLTPLLQVLRSLRTLQLLLEFHSCASYWKFDRKEDRGLLPRMVAINSKFQHAVMNVDVRQEMKIWVYDEEDSTREVFQGLVRLVAAAKGWHCLVDNDQYEKATAICRGQNRVFHSRWKLRPASDARSRAEPLRLNA